MLEKHYEMVVLGAGEIAKAVLIGFSNKKILVISRNTESIIKEFDVDGLDWIAGHNDLPVGITADVVVNCIMPATKKVARAGVDLAINLTERSGVYIHLSTIALKALPRNFPRMIPFAGDGYIRIKRAELAHLHKFTSKARIIYPGIVIGGKTGWDNFFVHIQQAKIITTGVDLNLSAPVISLMDLVKTIAITIDSQHNRQEIFAPSPDKANLPKWRDLVVGECSCVQQQDYLFFSSRLKEAVTIMLTSKFVPDWLWEKFLMRTKKLEKTNLPTKPCRTDAHIAISGMTNFYIGCRYTR